MDNKIKDLRIFFKDGSTFVMRALTADRLTIILSTIDMILSKISDNIISKIVID